MAVTSIRIKENTMKKAINYLLIGLTTIVGLASLAFYGLPYGSVEATVARWVAQAYPEDSQISGVVLYQDSSTGALSEIANIDVILYESIDDELEVITQTVTSNSGTYLFSDLRAGSYYLAYFGITPEGFAYEFYNNVTEPDEATPFVITSSGTQINVPTVILDGPTEPLGSVTSAGGGNVNIDPITGQVFINRPISNVSLEFSNPCVTSEPTSISMFYNGRAFPLTRNSTTGVYRGTITQDAMTVDSADIFLDYTCPTRATEAVVEIVGRITLFAENGTISSPLTGGPLDEAYVSLYHIDGATPDSGTANDGDCRTTASRPQSGSWAGLPLATVNQSEFVTQSELRNGNIADPPINPQVTGTDGEYGWGLDPGCYYVVVSGVGYADQVSPVFGVRSDSNVNDLDLDMVPIYFYLVPYASEDPNAFR